MSGATNTGGRGWGRINAVGLVALGAALAACGSKGHDPFSYGDAVMMSDRTPIVRAPSGKAWKQDGMTVISANLIHAAESTAARFSQPTEHCMVYEGVTSWASTEGLSPITIRSSRQTLTGSFNGTRYVLTGLQSVPAFADSDTMKVTATDGDGDPISVSVAAPPPPADVTGVLGEPRQLSTEFRAPESGFDVFYVAFIGKPGSSGGDSGGMCTIPADKMPLKSGARTAPLLSTEIQDALEDRGIDVQTVYAAYYRTTSTTKLFPGGRDVPVQAGRMFEIDPAELF